MPLIDAVLPPSSQSLTVWCFILPIHTHSTYIHTVHTYSHAYEYKADLHTAVSDNAAVTVELHRTQVSQTQQRYMSYCKMARIPYIHTNIHTYIVNKYAKTERFFLLFFNDRSLCADALVVSTHSP